MHIPKPPREAAQANKVECFKKGIIDLAASVAKLVEKMIIDRVLFEMIADQLRDQVDC